MSETHGGVEGFSISTDKSKLQLDRVHEFLSTKAYWSLGISRNVVERAVMGSICFGLYKGSDQVGFARIVTDASTFAWVCDVYIEDAYRGQGLSKWLMQDVLKHPALQKLRAIRLGTKDAHGLYSQFGFRPIEFPERLMEIKNDGVYR